MDYRIYHLSLLEWMEAVFLSMGVAGGLSYLFYKSFWGMLMYPAVLYIVSKKFKNERQQKRKETLILQYLDALRAVSTALTAGYAMENAWQEAQKEIRLLYGDKAIMYLELEEWNRAVRLNVPLEQLMESFGERSGDEDIVSFSEVFAFAKRSGSNFVKMMEDTTDHLRRKKETENEIAVSVASRRMEQKVMNVIPLFLLFYLQNASGEYMDVLYSNPAGILFMSVCLLLYAVAYLLSERMLQIAI